MKNDICTNLKRINEEKNFSLKYMSLLNKINYESFRTMIRRDSKPNEELTYQFITNYNLTIKQLMELKQEEKYHKMIDQKYYWNIIYYVNTCAISKQTGLKQIAAILTNADGSYNYLDKEISFNPEYDITDYLKYSASLILVNKTKVIKNNYLDPVSASIEEEISIINDCLDKVNKGFSKDILKDIFFYKYILGLSSNDIQEQLKITKNRYYRLLNDANNVAYRAFGLYTDEEIRKKISCISNY